MPNAMAREIVQTGAPSGASGEAVLSLVNPLTGLANDYLNVYNEILLLLEFLPSMPEMTDDALAWRPRGYCEYFEQSPLPGASEALRAYVRIDPNLRAKGGGSRRGSGQDGKPGKGGHKPSGASEQKS